MADLLLIGGDNIVKVFWKIFGNDTFIDVICLDTGADKDEILAELAKTYKDNWWIEDKPSNVDDGIAVGFKGILVEHGHNMGYQGNATVIKNWEEIYEVIERGN